LSKKITASLLLITVILQGCVDQTPLLEQIKRDGTLSIITRNGSTTYYLAPDNQPTGLEYELASLFADHLGVELEVKVVNNLREMFTQVARQDVHFAAAGLTITEQRKNWVRFTRPIQQVSQQIIYRQGPGKRKPHTLPDLYDRHLEVVAHSSHVERLQQLKVAHPRLRWTENERLESEELLDLVKNELVDYIVIDSNELLINQHLYPRLAAAFDITKPEPVAWAFPLTKDTSLYDEANRFIEIIKKDGTLDDVLERHYSHVQQFDHVGTITFLEHVRTRLPQYEEAFKKAAVITDMDWLLLAAMGYQESHWNAEAVSPTGVRGLMMLTNRTAKSLGVKDRRDPFESIAGGARYIRKLHDKLPASIQEPDRMWMAMASYNVGLGHLKDARHITRLRKGNMDKWVDVKDNLPLLRKRKWYRRTRYGYARGNEAVRYVENIRNYYEILHKHFSDQKDPIYIRNLPLIDAAAL